MSSPPEGMARLSLVVPSFNEERRIAQSMERIGAFLQDLHFRSEVVAVDDGSSEAGRSALNAALDALPEGISRRVVRHEVNRGKGAAVRSGVLIASGTYVAFIDADLATPPEEIPRLLEVLDAGADVVVGVRNQQDGSDMRNQRGMARRLAGRSYARLMNLLLRIDIHDSQCPLKAFRAEAARSLCSLQRIETWSFDAELLFLAKKLRLRVEQVPVRWQAVAGSKLHLNLRTARELINLLRIPWMHRKVAGKVPSHA